MKKGLFYAILASVLWFLFSNMKKYIAEMIGTMVLVLMGCGSAVFAGSMAAFLNKTTKP